jgi:hypothetical protein
MIEIRKKPVSEITYRWVARGLMLLAIAIGIVFRSGVAPFILAGVVALIALMIYFIGKSREERRNNP